MTGDPAVPPQYRRIVSGRPPLHRNAFSRYQDEVRQIPARMAGGHEHTTSFTRDHRITRDEYHLETDFRDVVADDELADLFRVEVGDPLLERRFVFYAKGIPQQMSTSYLLLGSVDGTPVMNPANEPWPGGTVAQLATLGVFVSRVEESVAARMPLSDEETTLRIPAGVPVLTIARRMLAGPGRDQVVEVADIVIPADRMVLDYAVDLSVWPDVVQTFYQSQDGLSR